MTHSGRVFAPKYTLRVSLSPKGVPHEENVLHVPLP